MNPPITRYKDEVSEESENNLVNNMIDKEMNESALNGGSTPELKVLPVKKQEKKQTASSSIVNAFRQKMSMNTTSIELPSAGISMEFKDINGGIQKELSRIALESDSRSDIMYCAMLSVINRLAMDKSFDIRDYSEFERISIVLTLQQINKMNPEIKYTCQKCGKENKYRLDTRKLLKDFNKTYRPDEKVLIESGSKSFEFMIGWPSVKVVEDFFKNYYKKYDNSSNTAKNTTNQLSQVEYITMFIKKIDLIEGDDKIEADLEELTYNERVQILDCLPQTIVFDDESGVISKVLENYVTPMNDCFKYRDCEYCGTSQDGAMANMTDFIGG